MHIVIYHKNCLDGVASAWVVSQQFSNVLTFPISHSYDIPYKVLSTCQETDTTVYLLDIVYPIDKLKQLIKYAGHVVIIDHHKSNEWITTLDNDKVDVTFNTNYAASQLTWKKYNDDPEPMCITHIAERDLWQWDHPNSRLYTTTLNFYNAQESVETFASIIKKYSYNRLVKEGKTLHTAYMKECNEIASRAIDCIAHSIIDDTQFKCRVVECPFKYRSEVGNMMVEDNLVDFAALYSYNLINDVWVVSLRAKTSSTVDCTKIIKHLGEGGGHAKAAGVRMPRDVFFQVFKPVSKEDMFK